MRKTSICITHAICVLLVATSVANAWPIGEQELGDITRVHKRWWGSDLEWKFDKLPASSSVDKNRMPYAGHIYPDNVGGCELVLRKYDKAFHPEKSLAVNFERQDIASQRTSVWVTRSSGGFFRRTYTVRSFGTPHWHGHCNGWAAAAIRHAEPMTDVTRNGVVFTPSDIKGILSELYVYNGHELLGGAYDYAVNPATLHVILGNWLGLKRHPIAMDNSLGKEIWNYPIYSYKSTFTKHGDRQVEVSTNLGFVNSTDQEHNQAPKQYNFLYLHYFLDLDEDGKIAGGGFYRDSNQIDLLWVPLKPTPGGSEANKRGNPHLDVKDVIALWRDSVPAEARADWHNINPWQQQDAIVNSEQEPRAEQTAVNAAEPNRADIRETVGLVEVTPAGDVASEAQVEPPPADSETDNSDE
jgi:hypothetical protein